MKENDQKKGPTEQAEAADTFPMRINKYLAHEGRGSRREIDRMIEAGRVLINGRRAVLGDKIDEGDQVEIVSGPKSAKR